MGFLNLDWKIKRDSGEVWVENIVLEDVIVALMRFLALVVPPSTHFTVNPLLPAGILRYCSHR